MPEQLRADKDPDAVLDYKITWEVPEGDSIESSSWALVNDFNDPDDLHIDSEDLTGNEATVWLSKGLVYKTYEVRNRVTTVEGRTDDQTLFISIHER